MKEFQLFIRSMWGPILALALWLWGKDRWGEFIWNKGNTWFWIIIVIWVIVDMGHKSLKYISAQFICNDFSGSMTQRPSFVKSYVIFPIGGVNGNGLSWKGKDATLIVHRKTIQKYGNQWCSSAKIFKVDFDQLPPICRKEIKNKDFNDFNVYFGYFSEKQFNEAKVSIKTNDDKTVETTPQELFNELQKLSAENAMQEALLENKYKILEDSAGALSRLHKTIKPKKSFLERWKASTEEQEE